jgi:uncharacterized oligopeptide transporter (OPT) family protein
MAAREDTPLHPFSHGAGLAFVIPFWNTLSMFTGTLIAWTISKGAEAFAERYTIPVASGVIAGESLMGVFKALTGGV